MLVNQIALEVGDLIQYNTSLNQDIGLILEVKPNHDYLGAIYYYDVLGEDKSKWEWVSHDDLKKINL